MQLVNDTALQVMTIYVLFLPQTVSKRVGVGLVLSADERLKMPLVLRISYSCVQVFVQSCVLFSHGDYLAQK